MTVSPSPRIVADEQVQQSEVQHPRVQHPERHRTAATTPHGRGAVGNPHNRFERLEVEVDDEVAAEEAAPPDRVPTQVLRDTSRTILARNSSPDIPFDASINPYRGCEHGCAYCLAGDTPILMVDGSTRPLAELRVGDAIFGTLSEGRHRTLVPTRVLKHWRTTKPAFRVTLADGTRLVASGDHRFLTDRGWKHVTGATHGSERRAHLTERNRLVGFGRFARVELRQDEDYRRGYLCGLIRGDGHLASYGQDNGEGREEHYDEQYDDHFDQSFHGHRHQFRLALEEREPLDRAEEYLQGFGVPVQRFVFQQTRPEPQKLPALRSRSETSVERVRQIVAWPTEPPASWDESWTRGFLAGLFDAGGDFDDAVVSIRTTDPELIEKARQAFQRLGFESEVEVRGRGSKRSARALHMDADPGESLRFFHSTGGALSRGHGLEGSAVKSGPELQVVSVEPVGDGDAVPLYDITTGTGDFIADGVVSHNCYARPSHEFLGFSAGLDFESRILVKEDAAELLRRELSSPRWQPTPLALSGVTDPYQPLERKLRVTRGCLEVLADMRHPVAVITKSALVTRDLDLLTELAAHGAVRVTLSVTSLDVTLARKLEPRGAAPERRLAAVRALAEAGVPVGVNVAPVIPGLTDHEIPAILAAAAEAGATTASFVPLRLPGAVAPLFEGWLEAHFPERKEKVLNRVRSMRGGRLNDPEFGSRMRGEGVFADQIRVLFEAASRRVGLTRRGEPLSTAAFRRKGVDQLGLFG